MQKKRDGLPPIIWNKKIPNTNLENFKKIIREKYNTNLESYWDLHKWSIENISCFWEELWHYFDIVHSKPYDKVFEKTGPGFLDCEWFSGARFNFAENILKIRDDSLAIIYFDEYGCEERVTFHEMFEEVKLYAAAFKKNGLRKGDVVACYISNRKETVFAYLAATSIGALFGGPQPHIKGKAAAKFISWMDAKFLLAIDHHLNSGIEYHNINYLPEIADNVISLEKVIIIATRPETYSRDISNIKNSCLLKDFLDSGRTPDGTVPDLEFEQLPFSHPISISFTSGTTGMAKGPVHSAGTILMLLSHIVLSLNLKKGDVLYNEWPLGWNLWNFFIPCLTRGVTLFLNAGYPKKQYTNIWDLFSKFKVTASLLTPLDIDKMEKENIVPKPETNLEHLKIIAIGGCPPKPQNFIFIRDKIKEDVFVHNQYGSTETFCKLTGVDFNLPVYAREIQVPCLGIDVRCYDEEGNSVINQKGEVVITTPAPSLPIYLWKDKDNSVLKETYLSKYPGAWCQGDEMWVNPETRGFVVNGRTDDTIKQQAERFFAGDIYCAIHDMTEIRDSICVPQRRSDGESRAVLFIKMNIGYSFTKEFKRKVEQNINDEIGHFCVPEVILETKDIPYNLNNKKMESTIRKIIATNQVPNVDNIKNPECLKYYCDIPEIVNY